jgi:UDP-sugar transporter A1/2/3
MSDREDRLPAKLEPFEIAAANSNNNKQEMSNVNVDLKWIALVALIFQNSGLAIAMRYTFVAVASERYLPSTAVLIAEIVKLCISVTACFVLDAKMSVPNFLQLLHLDLVVHKMDWCKLTIPSVLYTLQNSLQYYSMSCLSAPVFQVLYQMKIITTAIFSVLILSKRLTTGQWSSIVALAVGVALVQLSQTDGGGGKENSIAGLLSVILGCCTSGFAGVYFEMVLKSSNVSIWMRNIQLSVIGIFFSAVSVSLLASCICCR